MFLLLNDSEHFEFYKKKIYNIDRLDYTDILFLNCIKVQKYIEKNSDFWH